MEKHPSDQNISHGREAEDELRLHHQIMANMAEGVALVRCSDAALVYVNSKFASMFGYQPDELISRPVATLNAATDKDPEEQAAEIIAELEKNGFWAGEIINVKKDGSHFWSHATVSGFEHSEHGKVWISIHNDITDKKEAQKVLQASEAKFKALFEQAGDYILILKPSPGGGPPVIADANQSALKKHGFSREELIGLPVSKLDPHVDPSVTAERDRCLLAGEHLVFETTHTRKDGSRFEVEVSTKLFTPPGAEPLFVCVERDITERKAMAEALARSEKKYRYLIENLQEGIWLIDQEGLTTFINQSMAAMLGYSVDEMLGRPLVAFMDERGRNLALDLIERRRQGITEQHDFEFMHKNGSRVYTTIATSPIYDKSGRYAGAIAGIMDITERKRAEELVAKSRDEWENTFNAISDIITIQDKNFKIVRANKAAYETFGKEFGELKGRHCYEIFRGTNAHCQNCPELITMKEARTHFATVTHANLGKIFQVSSSPILDEHGNFDHIVHIAKDITKLKKMEDELFQTQKMEAIGTLAGGIAHDFNNILAAILGYADMAGDDLPEGSRVKSYVDQVTKAGNRAKELVKQILTFSRRGPETQEPLQPSTIIKEGLKLMRASLPTTIDIRIDIAPDCGLIMANPTNIHQIMMNLCTNALHAMADEKGTLSVTLRRMAIEENDPLLPNGVSAGVFVELMVCDTGCGMEAHTIEHIFEPYFTTKDVGKGSGMGLALVHGIVEVCGGFIRVESELGAGSCFYVYFPALTDDRVSEISEQKQTPLPRGNEHILVVDDEEAIVGFYRATLEKLGYKVTALCNSEQALKIFQDNPNAFDLIITDQTMPHLPGSELSKKILKIRENMPIIICTGYSSMISEKKAKRIGIQRLAMKPLGRSGLAMMVREVLDKKATPANLL